MFEIHDSMEMALNIAALIPCLILIILYLIDFKKLKYPNYFKLELMIAVLANIILNFVKDYKYFSKTDEQVNCINHSALNVMGLIKSYIEVVNICLLASFNYLCYVLLTKIKEEKKSTVVIALSLISWILPIYIFILYISNHGEEDFISISGICIFLPDIKKNINLYFIPFLFLFDSIFYILTIIKLKSRKKEDEEDNKGYKNHIKRITLNYISHVLYFLCLYFNSTTLEKVNEKTNYKFYHINDRIAFTIISIICFIEGKTREYYNKILASCFKFEKIENDKSEDEEEEEDDDDNDEDLKVYRETRGESVL